MNNASRCVWWPGLRSELKQLCESCSHCLTRSTSQRAEPLRPTPLPSRPWEKLGMDLCTWNNREFLVVVDYYSRWIEIKEQQSTTSRAVINKCRQIFCTHGIPEEVMSDNGPQFSSREFAEIAEKFGFHHSTSSPHFPQANGEAESAVKMAKKILSSGTPDIALLNYRATVHSSTGVAPSVALMSRILDTKLPVLPEILTPLTPDDRAIRQSDAKAKATAKHHYDRHHGARPLNPLTSGTEVLVRSGQQWRSGTVLTGDPVNRTYLVNTGTGVQRRNRTAKTRGTTWSSRTTARNRICVIARNTRNRHYWKRLALRLAHYRHTQWKGLQAQRQIP